MIIMEMPYLAVSNQKIKDEILQFRGFDNSPGARLDTLHHTKNLSAAKYPYAVTRGPREVINTLTNPKALFAAGKLCWVDGTDFYYDGTIKGTVTAGPKSIVDINGHVVIFPDKVYYDYIGNLWGSFTSPDIDYATVWNNRVWGVKDQDIYASKLGDFKLWSTFDGLSSDSYATDVAGNQPFNGIVAYQNHITLFQLDNKFYEVYGDKPSNFSVHEVTVIGTLNSKAIEEVNSMLYYLHRNGVQVYSGGLPRPISENIDKKYVSGVFGSDKKVLYASLYDGTSYDLFTYDTYANLWYREDNLSVIDFAFLDGVLYGLAADGSVIKFNSGIEVVDWELETQEFTYQVTRKKQLKEMYIRLDIELGSEAYVYIRYDNKSYDLVKRLAYNPYYKLATVALPVRKCESFQVKIAGKGSVTIKEIYKKVVLI